MHNYKIYIKYYAKKMSPQEKYLFYVIRKIFKYKKKH